LHSLQHNSHIAYTYIYAIAYSSQIHDGAAENAKWRRGQSTTRKWRVDVVVIIQISI